MSTKAVVIPRRASLPLRPTAHPQTRGGQEIQESPRPDPLLNGFARYRHVRGGVCCGQVRSPVSPQPGDDV